MITVEVGVEKGAELLIAKQRYYQEIGWFHPKRFQIAYETHDPWPLFPHANPFEICIDGACMDGAYYVVSQWSDTDL